MEPIVNPWVIYGIEVLQPLNIVVAIGLAVAVIGVIYYVLISADDTAPYDLRMEFKKNTWKPVVLSVVFGLLFVVLPSRDTACKVLVASYVTTDNVKAAGTATVNIVLDSVVKHVKELKD